MLAVTKLGTLLTGSLQKELASYYKEKDQEAKKIEQMKNENADEYDIRQMVPSLYLK